MKLKWVCILGQDKIAGLMTQHGANVSATNNRGNSALHWAAYGGNKIIKNDIALLGNHNQFYFRFYWGYWSVDTTR